MINHMYVLVSSMRFANVILLHDSFLYSSSVLYPGAYTGNAWRDMKFTLDGTSPHKYLLNYSLIRVNFA